MTEPQIHVSPDPNALARDAAARFTVLAREAIAVRGAFHVALSGGSTPRRLYQALAAAPFASQVQWPAVHVYFGDERAVPPEHPDSNYRMARESLLEHVPVTAAQVHRMHAELAGLRRNAAAYGRLLTEGLPLSGQSIPRLDLVLLGLGNDGHTASLFPNTCILRDPRPVAAVYVPRLGAWRMSITLPVINGAWHVLFMVAGAEKAEIVQRVLREPAGADERPLPAQAVQPGDGRLEWYLDQAAAARLI